MRFVRTDTFKRDFKKLSYAMKRSADKALRFFINNPHHPSLRVKKMQGQYDAIGRDIWEARVNQKYRFTFTIDADVYILYRIGPHDIERHPR